MAKLSIFISALLLALPFSVLAQDERWYFPIQGYENRNQYKTFNQYWNKSSYKGKEALFPTQFTGYHVADDLEINKGEENQNVSIYAVSDGIITLAGPVSGYGGLILLNMADDSHTALYGHVKLSSLKVKAGDSVKAGQELAYLGNAFSSETGGERKHLHFGIYSGKGVYYRGYESNESIVRSKWVEPAGYLKSKGAVDISRQSSVGSREEKNINQNTVVSKDNTPQSDAPNFQTDQTTPTKAESKGFVGIILQYLDNLFSKIRSVL